MGKRLTLVTGGARSGKSDFAQKLALKRGGDSVLFVASAEGQDEEMQARIAAHRVARPAAWQTLETPREIARALQNITPGRVVLLDCATLWTSNVMLADEAHAAQEMTREMDELLAWYRESSAELIVVSNEVGMGLVPPYELGRLYRDLLGTVNRRIASAADEVFLLIAGLPIDVKKLELQTYEISKIS